MQRWNPDIELNKREQAILKRPGRTRKRFKFLRLHRHEIFDESFQDELAGMYRQTGAGDAPVPPARLCLVVLQAYFRTSDAEAMELSIMDARWSMVLGCLGSDDSPFSQGGRFMPFVGGSSSMARTAAGSSALWRLLGRPRDSTERSCPRSFGSKSTRAHLEGPDARRMSSICWDTRSGNSSSSRPRSSKVLRRTSIARPTYPTFSSPA